MTYSCETSGCDEEGICRCGKIVDEHVMSVDLSLVTDEIYDQLFPRENQSDKRENILSEIFYGGEKVDKYCIYRILAINESYYPENWRVNISGGYYGDEIDGKDEVLIPSDYFTNNSIITDDEIKVAIKWNGATADVFVNGIKVVSATAFLPAEHKQVD
jgi:hypothetical protein